MAISVSNCMDVHLIRRSVKAVVSICPILHEILFTMTQRKQC